MKAMIFAAGLGSRLYPLTSVRPKALIEVAGKTLLERAIEKVREAGYTDLVINVHHFGAQIIRFLVENHNFGLNISVSDESGELLDTGGAILKAASWLDGDEPFLVYNVDVLSDIDLKSVRKSHIERGGLATLVVRDRPTARYLAFDETMRLSGWKNIKTGEEVISRLCVGCNLLAFSGIQFIEPRIFNLIIETGPFPIIPLYLRLAANHAIYGYQDQSSLWMDLGKPDQLLEAEHYFERDL